jgi:hypothetical protein
MDRSPIVAQGLRPIFAVEGLRRALSPTSNCKIQDQSRIPVILMLPCLDLYLRFKEMITPVSPSMT